MPGTFTRHTLSEQRASARSAVVPARLFGHCVCNCGHPFVWRCFYSTHGRRDGALEECFPYCATPCPDAVERCEMCVECMAFADPKDQAPTWWSAKRFSETLPASHAWMAAPHAESGILGQLYRALKRT
jgi:hypothetical protein